MTEESKKENNIEDAGWEAVEAHLVEGAYSGYKSAIIEIEKIFKKSLEEKAVKYDSDEDLFFKIADRILELEKLKYAKKVYDKIINLPNYNPTYFETRNTIEGYYLAISDIQNLKSKISLLKFNLLWMKISCFVKKFAFFIFGIFVAAVILADTASGRSCSDFFLRVSRFVIYKALPVLGGLAVLIVVILLVLKIMRMRRKN